MRTVTYAIMSLMLAVQLPQAALANGPGKGKQNTRVLRFPPSTSPKRA